MSAKDLLLAFLSNSKKDDLYWDVHNFVKWAKFIKTVDGGLIRKQGKAGIKALEQAIENDVPGLETTRNVAAQILTEHGLERALSRDTGWLIDKLIKTRQSAMEFPKLIESKQGKEALSKAPKVIVGTIHSVKGGEANTVYVIPDISPKSAVQLENDPTPNTQDSILRMFYVALTRSKEDVIILNPATKNYEEI